MRLLGLDIGESRIGIAVTDELGMTAQPLETIRNDEHASGRISRIAADRETELLVVGMPLLLDGREGSQARLVREFAGPLAESIGLPLEFVDERLTTRQAEAVLAGGRARRSGRKEASDRLAAALILRAYLDSHPEE